jgi:RimJ/RimL family protein N-acetyltransferase
VSEIETERLLLRLPRLEDTEPLLALYADPEAMPFIGGVHAHTAADPEFVIRRGSIAGTPTASASW